MKKIVLYSIFGFTVVFNACSEEEVTNTLNLDCTVFKNAVINAKKRYEKDPNSGACLLYRSAILEYKEEGCGNDFDTNLEALLESCTDI